MNTELDKNLTEKQQENKKEDRKAFKKFLLWLLVGFLFGLVCGIVSKLIGTNFGEEMRETAAAVISCVLIFGEYVVTTVLFLAGLVLLKKSRREFATWDEEDEEALCSIETKLSYVIWFSNLLMYGSYFFFAAGIWAVDIASIKECFKAEGIRELLPMILVTVHIVYAMVTSCVIQQRAVNMTKEINPEKSGSIYDMKFQNKWLEYCDEAERYCVYKCSYKTFKTMQYAGMILWIVCIIGQVAFDTGVFATIITTVFLLIQTSVYSVQSIYFAKHPSEVMK